MSVSDDMAKAAIAAVRAHRWREDFDGSAHSEHRFDGGCAVCAGELDKFIPVALDAAEAVLAVIDPGTSAVRVHVKAMADIGETVGLLADTVRRVLDTTHMQTEIIRSQGARLAELDPDYAEVVSSPESGEGT